MTYSHVLGTGTYAPSRVLTNQDLEKIVETSDAWITERTGIKERRIAADNEATSDMAVEAAKRALAMAQTDPVDLDMIVVGTISPDMQMPACAVLVQAKLGAKRAFAFDLSAACAGTAAAAVAALRGEAADLDLAAACAFARRRRLGPYRRGAADRARELGAFARAGFGRRVAETVLGCADVTAVQALMEGGID